VAARRKSGGPARRRRVHHIVSAGGVVFRTVDGRVEVVLVGRVAEGVWALPKGTIEVGESLLGAARREVREETGLDVEVVCPIIDIEYSFTSRGRRMRKMVRHFLLRPVGGDTSLHDPEYDVAEWIEIGEAASRLTHSNETHVLALAADLIRRYTSVDS